jgi:hypothetical protein
VIDVVRFPATGHGRFGYIRLKVLGCASGLSRFVFRQVRQGFVSTGIPRHLTIRSSRPRVVASAMCFTLRLHMSAAPPQGGLTQALGGRKTFGCCIVRNCGSSASLDAALRKVIGPFALRPRSWCALKLHMCCVRRFRTRCAAFGSYCRSRSCHF